MNDAKQAACAILRPVAITPHDRGNGARTTPLVTRAIGATGLLNGITEFAPGAAIDFHMHNCEESVIVLDGEAIADIGGAAHRLGPTETAWIAPNVAHRFRNASATKPMRIFWTYASIDATRSLVATGETHRIDAERAETAAGRDVGPG